MYTHTNCQQGHTSPGATDGHCVGYFWNMANSSARDYFVDNLVAPLATAPMIDGICASRPSFDRAPSIYLR